MEKYKRVILLGFTIHNKNKISDSSWNEELQLTDGSYYASDIQDYFEYILKNMRLIIL